jgi:hypothetical protein
MNVSGKLETAANVSTIVAALLLSAVMLKVYFIPTGGSRPPQAVSAPVVGTSVKGQLPGVDWQRNGRTLVLALSTQCRLCTESAPFLRRLADGAGKGVKIVAVLPQPLAEAEQYLKGEGVRVDQVKQATPGSIGVRGMPTMLLVNERAVVTGVWEGKVDAQQQDQALRYLLGEPGKDFPATSAGPFGETGALKNSTRR